MTGAWTLTLNYPRPPKGLHSNDRADWRVASRNRKTLRAQVALLARSIPQMQRCRVQIVWVVGDKRKRDTDGPDPFCKAIYDALGSDRGVSARIVPDDSPEFMEKPRLVIEHQPKVTAHFRVEITDISHRPDAIDQLNKEYEL